LPGAARFADALLAMTLLSVDPAGLGGAVVRARAGPVRDRLMSAFTALMPAGSPIRRLPVSVGDDRLVGGLDLAATLSTGRPVRKTGVLAESHGGAVIAAMAERMDAATAARIAAALDRGAVSVARDGFAFDDPARFVLVALDEAIEPDEAPPVVLTERLAFRLDLDEVALGDCVAAPAADIPAARARLPSVVVADDIMRALLSGALRLGVEGLRAGLFAVAAARAHAALAGRPAVISDDAIAAARLVLAPRATRMPEPEQPDTEPEPEEPPPPPPPDQDPVSEPPPLDDMILEAATAALPAHLLASLAGAARARAGSGGRAEMKAKAALRGRPVGTRRGEPRGGYRLAVVDTLRAAAPWQPVRRRMNPSPTRVHVHKDDFRIKRFEHHAETTTIFVVDASGSAALHRLAEAKGAVELLLAECYVRRDKVALIAFRGAGAEILLPPTRSLVRAKRSLAGLPGGGGTPLARAIEAAGLLARDVTRRGGSAVVVFLSDGKANIDRAGNPDRSQAGADAQAMARQFSMLGITSLFVDTSPRPQEPARTLAGLMRATYLPLPSARAEGLSRAVMAASG
jgi:magnesium chelatase subunit D